MTIAQVMLLFGLAVAGGERNFNVVKPFVEPGEKNRVPDIWVLDFIFRQPRFITVNIPGEGRKTVWYMTYRIRNRTGAPRTFIPRFTLVTAKGQVYQDVILPQAEHAVMTREDPTRHLNNSITISKPIGPEKAETLDAGTYGVVFWENVDMKAKSFTVHVSGLSNGYVKIKDPKTETEVIKRKVLVLNFVKPGDIYDIDEREIRLDGDPKWDYAVEPGANTPTKK